MNFYILIEKHLGDSILDDCVYHYFLISSNNKYIMVDLLTLGMVYSHVILGVNFLRVCYASIYCRTRVVIFHFPSEQFIELRSSSILPQVNLFHTLSPTKWFPRS